MRSLQSISCRLLFLASTLSRLTKAAVDNPTQVVNNPTQVVDNPTQAVNPFKTLTKEPIQYPKPFTPLSNAKG